MGKVSINSDNIGISIVSKKARLENTNSEQRIGSEKAIMKLIKSLENETRKASEEVSTVSHEELKSLLETVLKTLEQVKTDPDSDQSKLKVSEALDKTDEVLGSAGNVLKKLFQLGNLLGL